jgi:D-alanyl-D-alanine dipeptidase
MRKITSLILFVLFFNSVYAQSDFPFIEIEEVSSSIIKEIRYVGSDNFVGSKVDGYNTQKCYLTKSAAEALVRVQEKLEEQSLSLKVFDCFRPQRAVDHFVRWSQSPEVNNTKDIYFPNVEGTLLFEEGYIAERSSHSRGSAVDLTIVSLPYVEPIKFDYDCTLEDGNQHRGSELDMGTAFDCFDDKSHTFTELVSDQVLENRTLLVELMQAEGFRNYSKEWWHFSYRPEEYPETFFDFDID